MGRGEKQESMTVLGYTLWMKALRNLDGTQSWERSAISVYIALSTPGDLFSE